jgi:hypothetical protein
MSTTQQLSLDESAIAQDYINKFRTDLTQRLVDPETDPATAIPDAAQSSGLHGYISNLEQSVQDLSKRVERAGVRIAHDKPAVDADAATGQTPFELAAPVMRANAKASVRQSIAVVIAEVGVVAIGCWLLAREFRGPPPATQFGQTILPDVELRTYVLFAAALMVVSSIAGIVYVV